MKNDFEEFADEHQRLDILTTLALDADYSHNEHILQGALKKLGHAISQDKLRTHLAWLEEQRLVTVDTVMSIQVAKLTGRGLDVAQGTARVPGIARPRPGN